MVKLAKLTRKEFFQVLAGVVGVASLSGCGDDEGDGDGETDGGMGCGTEPDVSIQSNHGHSVSVPFADVEAAEDATYTLTGGDHEHELVIPGLLFEKLLEEGMLNVTTETANGHTHRVELTC